MAKRKPDGITLQCIGCKAKLHLDFEDAAKLVDQPMCERCLMPMIAIEARRTVR